MTTILQIYDRVSGMLADIASIDEAVDMRLQIDLLKDYARRIGDCEALARAAVLQIKTERVLGFMLQDAVDKGLIAKGRRPKDDPKRSTLEEIGVDKKLSAVAQSLARMSKDDLDEMLLQTVERIRSRKAAPINGSRAVMSSRAEPDDSLDYFPTPPWATRALIAHVLPLIIDDASEYTAWEPACGEGHMAEVLAESFAKVQATDIFDHGYGEVLDFLSNEAKFFRPDWIITNPPFGDHAEAFTLRAIEQAKHGVAMFVRLQWLETIGRYENLFAKHPPTIVAFFAERVNLCKGRWDPEGGTATAYIWLVWDKYEKPQPPFWIPPGCREQLSKPDDIERFTARPVMKRVKVEQEGEAA